MNGKHSSAAQFSAALAVSRVARLTRQPFSTPLLIGTVVAYSAVFAMRAASAQQQNRLSSESLQASQQLQQTARQTAHELVSGILESQLSQLEQNGLKNLEIYHQITLTRNEMEAMAEQAMPEVVALLQEAERVPTSRESAFQQARGKMREIVVRLTIERQKLLRRLRIAQLAAQVRSLIDRQTAVRKATESLSDATRGRQVEVTLATIQDEHDVAALFTQLIAAFDDAAALGGDVRTTAAEGLRILNSGQPASLVNMANADLESAKFSEAVANQQAFIGVLNEVLQKLESSQGAFDKSAHETLAALRDLEQRQAELRRQTQQADQQNAQLDKLVERQSEIRKDLDKYTAALEKRPAIKSLLEEAKAAMDRAAADLFNSHHEDAISDESKAFDGLAQVERAVQQVADAHAPNRSAADLAAQIRQLQSLQRQVAAAQKQEHKAAENRENAQSATAYNRLADNLAGMTGTSQIPPTVESRLKDAQAAARDAASARQSTSPSRLSPAERATHESLALAAAEIADAINGMELEEKALSAGELARAAEALERAASAERQLAKQAAQAASGKGISRDEAEQLIADQRIVKHVAEQLANGINDRSPEGTATLAAADLPINAAGHNLVTAQRSPGEATKNADARAAEQATSAADKLAEAAAQLRKAVATDANESAQVAERQIEAIKNDQGQMQATIPDAGLAARQERLEENKILAAQIASEAIEQQQARSNIVAAAAKLAAASMQNQALRPGGGNQPKPPPDASTLRALAAAEQQFAESQTRIGENVEQISGQANVGSRPIRGALESASLLGQHSAKQSAQESEVLGLEMVPESPQVTARKIAGQEASMDLANFRQQFASAGSTNANAKQGQSNDQFAEHRQKSAAAPDIGAASAAAQGGAGIKSGEKTNNFQLPPSELQTAQSVRRNSDNRTATDLVDRPTGPNADLKSQEPSWFAALPAEARNAIRAKSHQPAPKAYEDRLKDYFESAPDSR
jgi:hypothetical protein